MNQTPLLQSVDLHVHAGIERGEVPLDRFINALGQRGVTRAGFLDHVELHLALGEWGHDYGNELRKRFAASGAPWATGIAGVRQFYESMEAVKHSAGMLCAVGIEFNSIERTPLESLAGADYVSFCMNNQSDDYPQATYGERAAALIRDLGRKIRPLGKPGIVNHPFRFQIRQYRERLGNGEDMPAPEAFITRDDVLRMIDAAAQYDLAMEANQGDMHHDDSVAGQQAQRLCVHTLRTVVESNAAMSFGSDSHSPPGGFPAGVATVIEQTGMTILNVKPHLDRLFPCKIDVPHENDGMTVLKYGDR